MEVNQSWRFRNRDANAAVKKMFMKVYNDENLDSNEKFSKFFESVHVMIFYRKKIFELSSKKRPETETLCVSFPFLSPPPKSLERPSLFFLA